jgi:hypothetical protein
MNLIAVSKNEMENWDENLPYKKLSNGIRNNPEMTPTIKIEPIFPDV